MSVPGIDVSDYQTPAQWKALRPEFVGIKASEGGHTRDKQFGAHLSQAVSLQSVVIAYHFGWPVNPVKGDVGNLAGALGGAVDAGRVHALALDLEPYPDRRNVRGMTASNIQEWATEWVHEVQGEYPHAPVGVYADLSVFGAGWVPHNANFYWAAQYPGGGLTAVQAAKHVWPKLPSGYAPPTFWQWAGGPPLDADLAAFADADALRRWAGTGRALPKPATPGPTYTVRNGDTMSGIAAGHDVSLTALERANPQVHDPDLIHVGQVLHLPAGAATLPAPTRYTVRNGDTMSGIAAEHRVSLTALERANPAVRNPDLILIGQVLTIPARP